MTFRRVNITVFFNLVLLISSPLISQEIDQSKGPDSTIKKLLKLKTDYNKKIYESSFYTIQIYYGNLKEADSISEVFSEEFEEIETSLIFETPNYKVRVGKFKTIIDASKALENIKRKFRSAFILKKDEL
tara:strand:- start:79 stop:468 length:390 start_codon:yes stop_codon:yes gene_type:complete